MTQSPADSADSSESADCNCAGLDSALPLPLFSFLRLRRAPAVPAVDPAVFDTSFLSTGRFRIRFFSFCDGAGRLSIHGGTSQPELRMTLTMERRKVASSRVNSVIARPLRSARPVRPMR